MCGRRETSGVIDDSDTMLWGVLASACVKYISRSVCSQNPHTRTAARKTVVGAYVDVTDDQEDMESSFSTHPYPEEYVRSRLFNVYERQKFAEAEQLTCQPSIKCTDSSSGVCTCYLGVHSSEKGGEREVSFTLLYLLKRCLCYKTVFVVIESMEVKNTVVAFRSCMKNV